MTPISVFIITKNEADRIEKIICAVKKIANEIIVIDSGSTDKTCEISASLGAKLFLISGKDTVSKKFLVRINVRIIGF